jgi:hypothetical protein
VRTVQARPMSQESQFTKQHEAPKMTRQAVLDWFDAVGKMTRKFPASAIAKELFIEEGCTVRDLAIAGLAAPQPSSLGDVDVAAAIAAIEKLKVGGMKSDFFKGVENGLNRAIDALRSLAVPSAARDPLLDNDYHGAYATVAHSSTEERAATPGAFKWIECATRVLKEALKADQRGYDERLANAEKIQELLSGVPVPPQDLGFDSPADRYARAWHALNATDFRVASSTAPNVEALAQWVEKCCDAPADSKASVAAQIRALAPSATADAKDAARYRWLRDVSVPPHNFYLSVPDEFKDVRYKPREVDAAIDAAIGSAPSPEAGRK